MAHIRTIKPEFFTDPDNLLLSHLERLAFIGLWTQADREGRLEDDPRSLKLRIFPDQKINMESIMSRLNKKQIKRYTAKDGRKYIQILNFLKHQRPSVREAASVIPAPDMLLHGSSTTDTQHLPFDTAGKGREGKGKEGKGILTPGFAPFWDSYPRKVAKKDALRAWGKINPANGLVETILAALEKAKVSEQWQREGGKYIPYPASWLNGARWEDMETLVRPEYDTEALVKSITEDRKRRGVELP